MKLFDNSYFGKPYKTRGGEKALLQYKDSTLAHLFTESEQIKVFLDDGYVDSRFFDSKYDIVSEWKEEKKKDAKSCHNCRSKNDYPKCFNRTNSEACEDWLPLYLKGKK